MNARTILFLSMLTAGCLPPLDSDIKVDTLDTGDSRVDTEDTYLTDTDSPDDTGDTSDPVDTGDTSDPVDTGDTGEQYPEQCGREDTCTDCFTPTSMTVMAGFGYDAERGTMEPYTMNGYELGNYMTITFRDDGGALRGVEDNRGGPHGAHLLAESGLSGGLFAACSVSPSSEVGRRDSRPARVT